MKSNRTLRVVTICMVLSLATLWAGDFWEEKPYTEWSEKDVKKMLTSSPWAKEVRVSISGSGGSRGGGRRGGGGGVAGLPDSSRMGRTGTGAQVEQVSLLLRWESAWPVKQAAALNRWGVEAPHIEEAQQYLARQDTHYVISLDGLPRTFARMPEDQLKASTLLESKGRETEIHPEYVQRQPSGEGIILLFFFSRRQPIELSDKKIEFKTDFERFNVKRTFDLKKMVVGDELAV